MTMLKSRVVSASLLALFMAAGSSQVLAQQASQPQAPQTAPAMQASEISDKKLEKFAESLDQIMEIRQDFTAKLEKTGDPAEAQQLQPRMIHVVPGPAGDQQNVDAGCHAARR